MEERRKGWGRKWKVKRAKPAGSGEFIKGQAFISGSSLRRRDATRRSQLVSSWAVDDHATTDRKFAGARRQTSPETHSPAEGTFWVTRPTWQRRWSRASRATSRRAKIFAAPALFRAPTLRHSRTEKSVRFRWGERCYANITSSTSVPMTFSDKISRNWQKVSRKSRKYPN